MRVLVVGSGGREHALVRALNRSPARPEVVCAPGNAGIYGEAAPLPDADPADVERLARAAAAAEVELVVVGPEAPLVAGAGDAPAAAGGRCFGPSGGAPPPGGPQAVAQGGVGGAGGPPPGPHGGGTGGGGAG